MATSIPRSFKIIGILAILWNVFGLFSFIGNSLVPEMAFAGLTPEQQAYMEATPWWAHVVFGTATVTGLLGAIGLFLKKKWSVLLFLISMIAVLINQLYPILFTDFMELFGGTATLPLPMVIIAVAIALYFYAKHADSKGWLS